MHIEFDETRLARAASPQVVRRPRTALKDLLDIAPPECKRALQQPLDLLDREAEEIGEDSAASFIDAQRRRRAR